MQDVLKQIIQLREKAYNHGEEVAKSIGIEPHEMPAGVYSMIFNKLTLSLELLSHYYDAWAKATQIECSSVTQAKLENAQRVLMIQKMVFVEAMSSIEFCCKEYIKKYPQKIGRFGDKSYLRRIMEKSKEQGVITDSELTLWEGTIDFRNALVHNNGISQKTLECSYPNCQLILRKGEMVKGNLRLFQNLIGWLLDSSKYWILEMEKR